MKFPVILEGSILNLPPNIQSAPADERALQNRTPKTLRVDELRFRVMISEGGRVTDASAFATGEVQLRIGNEPITAGMAPLPAITWPELDYASEGLVSTGRATFGFYLRFSKPVYLAPGQRITAQFRHRSVNGNVDFQIVAMCRPEEPMKRPSFMPWLAFYLPPSRTDGTGNFIDFSTEADLVNPFDKEMSIERFIGRTIINGVSPEELVADVIRYPFESIRIRMEDHDAMQIVRDSTPFGVVFDFIKRSWVVNTMLKSKGFYKVTIESNLDPLVISAIPIQLYIGMLGYREVR